MWAESVISSPLHRRAPSPDSAFDVHCLCREQASSLLSFLCIDEWAHLYFLELPYRKDGFSLNNSYCRSHWFLEIKWYSGVGILGYFHYLQSLPAAQGARILCIRASVLLLSRWGLRRDLNCCYNSNIRGLYYIGTVPPQNAITWQASWKKLVTWL